MEPQTRVVLTAKSMQSLDAKIVQYFHTTGRDKFDAQLAIHGLTRRIIVHVTFSADSVARAGYIDIRIQYPRFTNLMWTPTGMRDLHTYHIRNALCIYWHHTPHLRSTYGIDFLVVFLLLSVGI